MDVEDCLVGQPPHLTTRLVQPPPAAAPDDEGTPLGDIAKPVTVPVAEPVGVPQVRQVVVAQRAGRVVFLRAELVHVAPFATGQCEEVEILAVGVEALETALLAARPVPDHGLADAGVAAVEMPSR